MKKLIYSSLVLSLCSVLNPARAIDTYTAQNVGGGRLNMIFRGFVDETYIGTQGTVANNVTASFNWAASTAAIQSFDLMFSGTTYTLSQSYTTGPGQTKTITAYVNVNPFTVSAASLPQYQLTPGLNGHYDASGYGQTVGAWASLPLNGNVLIQGPTQSTTIPFSVSIPVYAGLGFPVLLGVETAGYPGSLSLDLFNTPYDGGGQLLGQWSVPSVSNPLRLVQATVDGINVDIGTIGGESTSFGTFTLHPVPEPAISSLVLLGAGSVLIRRKTRRGQSLFRRRRGLLIR